MRSIIVAFSLLIFANVQAAAQGIGIGTTNPHQSAVVEMRSTTQGVLIPRMTTTERSNITMAKESGLMVYDITLQRFCFWNGAEWQTLNEFNRPAGTNITGDPQAVSLTGSLSVNGSVSTTGTFSAANYELNATGHGPIPKGGIIMWSGTVIPTGWALCDGGNNTPNLSGRFIVAYDASNPDYDNPGTRSQGPGGLQPKSGGAAAVALNDINQIPSHSHSITTGGDAAIDDIAGGYIKARQNGDARISSAYTTGLAGATEIPGAPIYQGGGYPCSAPGFPAGCNPNYYNIIGQQPSTYVVQPHENRPQFYVLAFIMKL